MAGALMRRRVLRRRLAGAAAAALVTAALPVAGSAPLASAQQPPINCQGETFPAAGTPRSLANGQAPKGSAPYGIPFTAALAGGYLQIVGPTLTVTLGGPTVTQPDGTVTGNIKANACGLVYLPNETGSISGNPYGASGNNNEDRYNNNFQFQNPIPIAISLTLAPGVSLPVLSGYGSADGSLGAAFEKTPAANGGINVDFAGASKATSILDPLALANLIAPGGTLLNTLFQDLGPLGATVQGLVNQVLALNSDTGGECTLTIGDLRQAGIPPADLTSATGLTLQQATSPVILTTGASNLVDPVTGKILKTAYGKPVTGNITNAQAALVSINFPVGKIDPNMPPSPDAPGATTAPSTLCTPTVASLFNILIGLPSPAGHNTFYAPGQFAINIPANG